MQPMILDLAARRGHFLMESGHHGDLWFELELLCRHPREIEPLADKLANRLSPLHVDFVCGPLVEGAFVGLMVAAKLGCEFAYSERLAQPTQDGLFPAGYRVPRGLRSAVRGKRVALINDVINAGSAVKGTFVDLQSCEAHVVAIASLLVLGNSAEEFAARHRIPLVSLSELPNCLWAPESCPLCAAGTPLDDVEGFASLLSRPIGDSPK